MEFSAVIHRQYRINSVDIGDHLNFYFVSPACQNVHCCNVLSLNMLHRLAKVLAQVFMDPCGAVSFAACPGSQFWILVKPLDYCGFGTICFSVYEVPCFVWGDAT